MEYSKLKVFRKTKYEIAVIQIVVELKTDLKKSNLSLHGRKAELITRLVEFQKQNSLRDCKEVLHRMTPEFIQQQTNIKLHPLHAKTHRIHTKL